MTATALRSEEQVGLGVALVAHAALIALLVVMAARKPAIISLPERVTVSLADEVSLTSTAPEPAAEAQASVAETLSDKPKPKPEVKKPEPVRTPPPMQRTAPREKPKPLPKNDKSAGSRLGDNFLQGQGSSETSTAPVAASQVGAAEKASIQQAIARQLARYWKPPSGADADQLVTILAFDLNPDGSLAGRPRVIAQSGINDANRPQAGRHAELAIRAVQLAAPFDLPPEYYNVWKHIKTSRFDLDLLQ